MSDQSSTLISDIIQYALTGGAGVAGRLMHHLHLAQRGERKPWWFVVCDMAIALVVGWTVLGLGDWFGIPFKGTQSLAIIAGWGGPALFDRMIDAGFAKWAATDLPPKKVDPEDGSIDNIP